MKRPLIGRKYFHNFHWTRRTNSRKGHGQCGENNYYLVFFFGRRGE
jgi:hypothetical protein